MATQMSAQPVSPSTPGGSAFANAHLAAPGQTPPGGRPSASSASLVPAISDLGLAPGEAADRNQQAELRNALRLTPACARMPVALSVAVPVRDFRVRHLLSLALGEVIKTTWVHSEDLPLASAEVQLAWTEFEVIDTKLAVRITRLA